MKIRGSVKNILLSNKTLLLVVGLWLVLQVLYVSLYWGSVPSYDGRTYLSFAQDCVDLNSWYPNMHNMSNSHLFAPGYVNLLILLHKLFGSFECIKIVNLLCNVALLCSVFVLAKKMFSVEVAKISTILFCVIFSNYTSPIAVSCDLPFLLLMMWVMLLVVFDKPYTILLAGVLLGVGNWVRPVAIVFILTSLVYMFANKYKFYNYILLFSAMLLTVFCIAKPVKDRVGAYLYTMNATGHNLAHATSEKASIFPDFAYTKSAYYADLVGAKYEKKMLQSDTVVKERAVKWILENPLSYASMFPKKFVYLYAIDNWTVRSIDGNGLSDVLKAPNSNKEALYAKILMQSSVYYFVMFLFGVYVLKSLKSVKSLFRKENIFLLVPALGTSMLLLMVVVDRYHYPFMPVIIIYAGNTLYSFVAKKEELPKKLP